MHHKTAKNGNSLRSKERGSAILELALSMPMLMLFLFGTADFGRLFYSSIEVANAAAAGAYYGSLSTTNMADTTGISNAAKNDAQDVATIQVSSTSLCQDSTGASESCATAGAYEYVQVTVTNTFNTLFNYYLLPSSVNQSKTVMMRVK